LPLAERFGLATRIDRWVVNETLRRLNLAPYVFGEFGQVSINLSGQSMSDPEFHYFVDGLLDDLAFPASRICFEITETFAVSNMEVAHGFINHMNKRGVRFSLDDFGSGSSSFGYLKTFPTDYLKIDGQFIKAVEEDEFDRMIVRNIVEMARVKGFRTVAEFVETASIRDLVADLGVDYVQGYHLHRPEHLNDVLGIRTVAEAA